MNVVYKQGRKFGKWTLVDCIGYGGNGEVWTCTDNSGAKKAIKILKDRSLKAWARFKDEINILNKIKDIAGILPIEDHHLSEYDKKNPPFYIMPIAQTSGSILRSQPIEDKVKAILQIAKTLNDLHSRDISHRDIKPENILYYNSRFVLGDFGLVHFPEKSDVSRTNENIGAKWTIAPEMKRQSSYADGKKADVYSLAKTLWIVLTNEGKSFDGQYSSGSIIELRNYNRNSFTTTLDNLLVRCTDNDPRKRPDISEFVECLLEWEILVQDFHERMRREWFEMQTKLFPSAMPERVIWTSTEDILKVLKFTCSTEYLNHVFFPISGGLDLMDVRISNEENCLELDFQVLEVVKPKRLIFESFGYDPEWNYFRLELDQLRPLDFPSEYEESERRINENYEDVTELGPGAYFPYSALTSDRKDFLINSYGRRIRRRFKGNYVIFGKRSTYNLISDTYNGRHDRLNADQFRDLITGVVKKIQDEKSQEPKMLPTTEPVRIAKARRYFLEEQHVHICIKCGNMVDNDGTELEDHEREYSWAVYKRFGHKVALEIVGNCCKELA
jgi:hypothetical protein